MQKFKTVFQQLPDPRADNARHDLLEVWLLDEPLTALDQIAQQRLIEILAAHLAAGGLIVAATHAPLDLPAQRELRLDDDRQAA